LTKINVPYFIRFLTLTLKVSSLIISESVKKYDINIMTKSNPMFAINSKDQRGIKHKPVLKPLVKYGTGKEKYSKSICGTYHNM